MTPNLLLLNLCSLALICLLGLFARHNKKVGWVKHRATFVDDLRDLQRAWDESDQRAASAHTATASTVTTTHVPAMPIHSTDSFTGVAGFTSQLSNLKAALKQTSPVSITENVEARETVAS